MARLSPVLRDDDLSEPELQAMRLDGQVYALADGWCPIDTPETPELRATSAMAGRSPRLIADLRTAAWIWGAIGTLHRPLELCADVRARARLRPGADAVVREVVLADGDVVAIADVRVTSPVRTVLDLARTGLGDAALLRRIADGAGLDRSTVVARLEPGRSPGDRRARAALEAIVD